MVPDGVMISSISSSVESALSFVVRGRRRREDLEPFFSECLAAAHAHSNVFFDLPSSRRGGLPGATGDEAMLSQRDALGSDLRVGVRNGAIRSSDREATLSREGRDDDVRLVIGDEEGCETLLRAELFALFRATLRSVWRLFWNHMVTDFGSLNPGPGSMFAGRGRDGVTYTPASCARASRSTRDGWEF